LSSLRRTDAQSEREIACGNGAQRNRTGQDRQNHSIHLVICALWISRIARDQLRHSGLWQRVFKSASRTGILRQPSEQSANGLLRSRDDRERCAATRCKNSAGLRAAIRLALHRRFRSTTLTFILSLARERRTQSADEGW